MLMFNLCNYIRMNQEENLRLQDSIMNTEFYDRKRIE